MNRPSIMQHCLTIGSGYCIRRLSVLTKAIPDISSFWKKMQIGSKITASLWHWKRPTEMNAGKTGRKKLKKNNRLRLQNAEKHCIITSGFGRFANTSSLNSGQGLGNMPIQKAYSWLEMYHFLSVWTARMYGCTRSSSDWTKTERQHMLQPQFRISFPKRVRFGATHYMTGRTWKRMGLTGGKNELQWMQSCLMLFALTTLPDSWKITWFRKTRKTHLLANGWKDREENWWKQSIPY